MRPFAFFLVFLGGFHAYAQTAPAPKSADTALGALKLLPERQAAFLVSIFAREGAPAPDRWYFVTYDAGAETGVREFVVSGNKLVAARPLSQFAQGLKPADVIGKGGLKVDSDKAGQIALDYGKANDVSISFINYEFKQEARGLPIWKLVCLDESSNPVGELKISAENASVISHGGFILDPKPAPIEVKLTPQPVPDRPAPVRKKPTPAPGLGGKLKHFFTGH